MGQCLSVNGQCKIHDSRYDKAKKPLQSRFAIKYFSVVCAIMISPYEKSDWMCSFFHINSI